MEFLETYFNLIIKLKKKIKKWSLINFFLKNKKWISNKIISNWKKKVNKIKYKKKPQKI